MSEPVIYNAAAEAMKEATAYLRDYVPPASRPEERDAIWNFEQIPGALQEQTDLRGWTLKTRDSKLELVKAWARQLSRQEGEDLNALAIRRTKIKRRLLVVIATEATAGNGNREVAAEAFKAVFPKE